MSKSKLRKILKRRYGHAAPEVVDEILSLLDENEVGVSDSSIEHGGLPHVRKSEGEAKETDTSSGESEQITLGNRIEGEKICYYSAEFGASGIRSEFLCNCDGLDCRVANVKPS